MPDDSFFRGGGGGDGMVGVGFGSGGLDYRVVFVLGAGRERGHGNERCADGEARWIERFHAI
jgi:hypothetical protein